MRKQDTCVTSCSIDSSFTQNICATWNSPSPSLAALGATFGAAALSLLAGLSSPLPAAFFLTAAAFLGLAVVLSSAMVQMSEYYAMQSCFLQGS